MSQIMRPAYPIKDKPKKIMKQNFQTSKFKKKKQIANKKMMTKSSTKIKWNKINQENDINKKVEIKKKESNLILILNEIKEWGIKLKNKTNQEKIKYKKNSKFKNNNQVW